MLGTGTQCKRKSWMQGSIVREIRGYQRLLDVTVQKREGIIIFILTNVNVGSTLTEILLLLIGVKPPKILGGHSKK